jgi:hypothetical protein
MARPNSLQSKIEKRIAESREYVFLTREFTDLSGRRQVLRALRKIVAEGRLAGSAAVYTGSRSLPACRTGPSCFTRMASLEPRALH